MKKLILTSALLVSALFAKETKEITVDLEQFKSLPMIKESSLILEEAKDIGKDWYFIQASQNGRKIGLYTDKEKMIIGRGFDVKSGKEIKFDIDMAKHKSQAAYKFGNGPAEYFVFTDPECPYCKQLDETLYTDAVKEKMTIYTFFYPLSFHLAANSMSKAILSQPLEKRAEYAHKMMQAPLFEVIKELDKYSSDLYKDIKNAFSNPNFKTLPMKNYLGHINKAYGIDLKTEQELAAFADKKINEIKGSLEIDNQLSGSIRTVSKDFDISGTPTIYDMEGKKIERPDMLLAKHNIIGFDAIKKIEENKFTVKMGTEGKEKLYIFSSTKCPHCIEQFENKQFTEYLFSRYEVHFVLMATGNGQIAMEELKYLYSISDPKVRAETFSNIMTGGTLTKEQLSTNYSADYANKINEYGRLLNKTMISSTPTIVSANGEIIKNSNSL